MFIKLALRSTMALLLTALACAPAPTGPGRRASLDAGRRAQPDADGPDLDAGIEPRADTGWPSALDAGGPRGTDAAAARDAGPPCRGTEACCSGICVDVLENPDHCGGCGHACGAEAGVDFDRLPTYCRRSWCGRVTGHPAGTPIGGLTCRDLCALARFEGRPMSCEPICDVHIAVFSDHIEIDSAFGAGGLAGSATYRPPPGTLPEARLLDGCDEAPPGSYVSGGRTFTVESLSCCCTASF